MGRRKKEPKSAHREAIASAAAKLFEKKGISAASMDDIAKAAGYSKATLYVYFENKEEIVAVLVMDSMKKLEASIDEALSSQESIRETYGKICQGLVRYQREFPFYFDMALERIEIQGELQDCLPEERETFLTGERINEKLVSFIRAGMNGGELRADMELMPAIFSLWGMLSGIVRLAAKKETYIQSAMGMTADQFMEYGFRMVYQSIANRREAGK